MKRGNRRYLALLLLIFALIGGYVAYWYYAMGRAQEAFAAAVAAERAAGNRFDFTSAEWGGFPIRIGVTLKGLVYCGRGAEIEAGTLMAEVMPWSPTRALVRADGQVRLASRVPDRVEWIEFRPALAFASIRFTLAGQFEGADAELREVRSDGTDTGGNDFSFNAQRLQFDAVYLPGGDVAQASAVAADAAQVAFSADQLMISEGFAPALGPRIASIRFAGMARGLPLYSQGGPAVAPDAMTLEVARLDFDWGGVSAKGKGALSLDAAHRPQGQIDFAVIGLGKLIGALRDNGSLQVPESAEMLPDIPGGTPITLEIKDGLATFGGFAIGEAPGLW